MGCPGGCWFFKECLTYSASDFLSSHSFGLPFPANLFCIPVHGPSSSYSSDSLSDERFGWTWFDTGVAFSLGPFSSDIVPYPFCNTRCAWKLFVFLLTKQVPYAIHVWPFYLFKWLLRMWWSSIYTNATATSNDDNHHVNAVACLDARNLYQRCRFRNNQQEISKQSLVNYTEIVATCPGGCWFVIYVVIHLVAVVVVLIDSVLTVRVIFRSCYVGNFFDHCILRLPFMLFPGGLFWFIFNNNARIRE